MPAYPPAPARVRRWVGDAVRYLWRRSDHSAALETAERDLVLGVPVFGDGDSLVILMRCQQANALRPAGKPAEAHALGLEVWEQARESLGEDDEYTLIAAGNLGADLRSTGACTKALDIDRATYRVSQRVHGRWTPRTLSAANNLAVSLFLSGDRQGAPSSTGTCTGPGAKCWAPPIRTRSPPPATTHGTCARRGRRSRR